ncbi:hypothetical protein BDY19DRAFT_887583 [Irpex rosettiformis]|uniref:Uncharacterized protein n=1 Tax=Irpex rosettiformis TaxID=378272 RepID=A0ACB8U9T2_9APHY|nr:hypothetical protein BDY19DRAFT_887583 [Irpex rosettiformis]
MGKLNIAHHKSYHPYRRDNIERVRRDEEEARLKEATQEGKIALADAEARIELLRQRAGLSKTSSKRTKAGDAEEQPQAGPSSLTTGGHINLFEDLERSLPVAIRMSSKPTAPTPTELGVPLAPSEKDRKPWYSEPERGTPKELEGDKQTREMARKSANDPLTSINRQLAQRSPVESLTSSSRSRPGRRRQSPSRSTSNQHPVITERLNRESSERQRALELIRRKKREMEGSATPSTVRSGMSGGYGDVFNRREVEDAHRHRKSDPRYSYDDRRRGWE